MGGTDLVVPIGADQQEVLQLEACQQVLEQVERGRVQPLQVVEEEGERMLGSGEDADEAPEYLLEACLRIQRRQLGHGWLFSDDVLQLRDQLDHQQAVRIQRLAKGVAP